MTNLRRSSFVVGRELNRLIVSCNEYKTFR